MNDLEFTSADTAEIIRKKARYRELILSGKVRLPYQRAAQLLGPDCLYHLYAVRDKGTPPGRRTTGRNK